MTEAEYIWVSNKTALMCLMHCAGEVQAGEQYGIEEEKWKKAYKAIGELTRDIFKHVPKVEDD
jgi:hypothetical protein